MKIVLLGDLHFGCKKNNPEFLNSQLRFFNECFFPYLEKNNIDTIINLGDTFDNRQNLNIIILNKVYELLERFGNYHTYIILGNHDVVYKTTNDVHSLRPFRHMHNINVIDDITRIMLGDKSCLLVPWQVDNEKFVKKVMDKNINCPIAIGHFEINGFNLNSSKVCDFGIPPDVFFDNYELTFSGHFHKRTIMKRDESKIIYTGNTYELTRADLGQPKGFCVLDTETMKYEFINNDVSIKHKKFEYPEKFSKEDIEGNIIDVIVDIGDDHDEGKFQSYMLTIDSYKPYDVDLKLLNNIDVHSKDDYKVQNTEELIENYISDVDIGNDKIKTSVNKKMQKLYKQCKQDG